MMPITMVDGTDLHQWADRRDAQGRLPQLVRRLIHASVQRVLRIDIPAGEGIQLGGWDGIVVVGEGNAYVPDGLSAWEFGVNRNIKGKADGDYEKRLNSSDINKSESTFIFVTLRRWGGKDDWIAVRNAEGIWSEVRAYDADDLEAWLELSPAVHLWLSILRGKHPEASSDIESFWLDWSHSTNPILSPEFFLAGRSEVVERIHSWLADPIGALSIQAESRREAIVVFAAALYQMPPDERVPYISRVIIVQKNTACRKLTAFDDSLILILAFDDSNTFANAVRQGHHVFVPLGRADSKSEKTITLPRLSESDAAKILIAKGIKEEKASDLARLARRSLMAFIRKIAVHPEVQQPKWACPEEGHFLSLAMLIGGWNERSKGDRDIVAKFTQVPYEEVQAKLIRWSQEDDPPIRLVGDTWYFISREDAWILLSRYLTGMDLERFISVAVEVLGTPDPLINLPADQRLEEQIKGYTPPFSGFLPRSIAETTAVMGSLGGEHRAAGGGNASDFSGRIVRELLTNANKDNQFWLSLAQFLPLFAEAAPDVFLDLVEEGMSGETPVVLTLFEEKEELFHPSSKHPSLLWALEALAWSPNYLSRAALVLARLARMEPGGKLLNRPQNSLKEIFTLWHPQTSATLSQRLKVINLMRSREPEVAWKLICSLLPVYSGSASRTSRPLLRDWAPDALPMVSPNDYERSADEIVNMAVQDVGASGLRWNELISHLGSMTESQFKLVLKQLEFLEDSGFAVDDRDMVWDALRRLLTRHQSYPDAPWALEPRKIERLKIAFDTFTPQNLNNRYKWLFSNNPQLPRPENSNYEEYQEAIEKAKSDSVDHIYKQKGIESILEFVLHIERPDVLGIALGKSANHIEKENELMTQYLDSHDEEYARFAKGFVYGRVWSRGQEWAEEKIGTIAEEWTPSQRATFLDCLPYNNHTWDIVEAEGEEVERKYWLIAQPFGIKKLSDRERALKKLLKYQRPFTAIDLLYYTKKDSNPPIEIILEALELVPSVPMENDRVTDTFPYVVSELLKILSHAAEISENRLAALEWTFLPILDHYDYTPRLLHRELTTNPNFFVEVMRLVFQGKNEEPEKISEEEQMRVFHGEELLRSWRSLPGTLENGRVDQNLLKDWVKQVRESLESSGHSARGDDQIGKIFSASPVGEDGMWPHEAVRDVIENLENEVLEAGFISGVYNSRGTYVKSAREGGEQERQLSSKYLTHANAIQDFWPRTASILRRISEHYRRDASAEDRTVELREDLGLH
jgi:hypothetical protein